MRLKNQFLMVVVLAAFVTLAAATVFAAEQTTCPVKGGKIDKSLYVDADGKRVYVCCGGCIDKVKADPQTYIKKLETAGVTLEKTPVPQTTCPVLGGKIDTSLYVDADGKRVYVCCGGCIGKVKADPKTYIKKLETAGVTLEKTPVPQTTCPVMGGKIDKSLYVDAEGKRIYVCCEGCIDKVKADPKTFIKKLEDQGVTLEKSGS